MVFYHPHRKHCRLVCLFSLAKCRNLQLQWAPAKAKRLTQLRVEGRYDPETHGYDGGMTYVGMTIKNSFDSLYYKGYKWKGI